MKIYLASSWKNELVVKFYAEKLRKEGHAVDAFVDASSGRFVFNWRQLEGEMNRRGLTIKDLNPKNFLEFKKSKRAYKEDKKWIDWAECIIIIMPAGRSSHLEGGYGKGCGKKLIIFYPEGYPSGEFDCMYGFADLVSDDFEEITIYLHKEGDEDDSK